MTSLILHVLLSGATAPLDNKRKINDVIMTSWSYHVRSKSTLFRSNLSTDGMAAIKSFQTPSIVWLTLRPTPVLTYRFCRRDLSHTATRYGIRRRRSPPWLGCRWRTGCRLVFRTAARHHVCPHQSAITCPVTFLWRVQWQGNTKLCWEWSGYCPLGRV